ncbi:MAG: maleylpyruvate isomerase family mycothiol-dependent enzyme, partial [Acidimicrobiales bacterium]
GASATLVAMLRHGFNFNRLAADGKERGLQKPEMILARLREAAGNREAPPAGPQVRALTHVLIHAQDICRPLGIRRELPESHLRPVADFVKSSLIFRAKKRIAGLRLTATDMDWSQGDGPEVNGPAEALVMVMVMAGRLAALDDLSGEGKPTLAARYA